MESLNAAFFTQNTLTVARELIGCYLVRRIGEHTFRLKITETEGYVGPHDLACHASKGRTKRTEVMFGEAGTLYVYMIYGMYFMLNVITEEKGFPAAVLIRSAGAHVGPGRLTRALEIDLRLNGKQAIPENGLWFEKRDMPVGTIKTTKRIGIAYAGPIWAEKEYRFVLVQH